MNTLTDSEKKKKPYVKPTMERLAIFSVNAFGIGLHGKTGQVLHFSKPEVHRPENAI